jgi:hypothetical protein
MGGAAVIGFLESKAKADAAFPLNKIPRPVKQLGYTGGTALALQVAAKFTGNRWLKLLAKSAWMVTAYQIGALGKVPDANDKPFSLSGFDEEHLLSGEALGHLSAEGDAMEGLPYDDRVEEPMA